MLIKHDVNHNVQEYFKSKKTLENRKEEVMAIKEKFPNKIPLIVERYHKEKYLPKLDKTKFLVPEDITMSQFLVIIRNRLKINSSQALYLIINNKSMLSMSLTMAQAYEHHADEDGFLYITYASQEVFGCCTDVVTGEPLMIRVLHPNKVPVIVTRSQHEKVLPILKRNKFLIPLGATLSQFMCVLRTCVKIKQETALYMMINDNVLPSLSLTMAQAFEEYRSNDGFLHISYATENVYG